MKKQEIVKANACLMIAIMFIDLDESSDTGHPQSQPVRRKIDKVLQNFNNARNGRLNIRANELAGATLTSVQEQVKGSIDVNVVAMCLLSNLEDIINMPKLYNMPSTEIIEAINTLADVNTVDIFGFSADVSELIIKEIYGRS